MVFAAKPFHFETSIEYSFNLKQGLYFQLDHKGLARISLGLIGTRSFRLYAQQHGISVIFPASEFQQLNIDKRI